VIQIPLLFFIEKLQLEAEISNYSSEGEFSLPQKSAEEFCFCNFSGENFNEAKI
jgi:hypothetical protein